MAMPFQNTKIMQMGMGAMAGFKSGGPWGALAGAVLSNNPDSPASKAMGIDKMVQGAAGSPSKDAGGMQGQVTDTPADDPMGRRLASGQSNPMSIIQQGIDHVNDPDNGMSGDERLSYLEPLLAAQHFGPHAQQMGMSVDDYRSRLNQGMQTPENGQVASS